ncbi:hypothetical protein Xcel_0132 [Xylanimonas cellulosilytica DSM 15894]|uniref:DUF2867 domain-containing protein n=1 Tax=Xylanimonas cellulosilytica (strain DSM 15894 / JCM 12276 / CECT 5975 / KCTC 9989 / LMG 20990 / NBRC 107835 / XIL07) TaxID=446471 RepID=D1BU08_XYLCX|nr:hypothetical protein [Xylanimonas cellulosilytica]ACZ29172.1 hypothetical protein Xcel_0132 [Xylanimonas cellulosilytica DSM 15894]
MADLPFVDEHVWSVAEPPDVVFARVERYVHAVWVRERRRGIEHLLGTRDPGGFHVAESVPGALLALEGAHRFSRYRLTFLLAADGAGTRVTARTHAAFPGVRGALYRGAVVGTGLHVVVTRRMLRLATVGG